MKFKKAFNVSIKNFFFVKQVLKIIVFKFTRLYFRFLFEPRSHMHIFFLQRQLGIDQNLLNLAFNQFKGYFKGFFTTKNPMLFLWKHFF